MYRPISFTCDISTLYSLWLLFILQSHVYYKGKCLRISKAVRKQKDEKLTKPAKHEYSNKSPFIPQHSTGFCVAENGLWIRIPDIHVRATCFYISLLSIVVHTLSAKM